MAPSRRQERPLSRRRFKSGPCLCAASPNGPTCPTCENTVLWTVLSRGPTLKKGASHGAALLLGATLPEDMKGALNSVRNSGRNGPRQHASGPQSCNGRLDDRPAECGPFCLWGPEDGPRRMGPGGIVLCFRTLSKGPYRRAPCGRRIRGGNWSGPRTAVRPPRRSRFQCALASLPRLKTRRPSRKTRFWKTHANAFAFQRHCKATLEKVAIGAFLKRHFPKMATF